MVYDVLMHAAGNRFLSHHDVGHMSPWSAIVQHYGCHKPTFIQVQFAEKPGRGSLYQIHGEYASLIAFYITHRHILNLESTGGVGVQRLKANYDFTRWHLDPVPGQAQQMRRNRRAVRVS
jgi:hypothetical protein